MVRRTVGAAQCRASRPAGPIGRASDARRGTSRTNPAPRAPAREAITFYRDVFGGELSIMTYADMQASEDPAEADKVMHGMLEADHFGMCVDRFGTHWLVNITGSEG